ncbi:hypothetical protein ACIQF6_18915 [Kitasatospora sp. NPDC092948]|uniref:hypothetical protein n=1 Tax=Kitasatospora sp. NPDC092948 TaxID=3364088 RepID=UPI0037FD8770
MSLATFAVPPPSDAALQNTHVLHGRQLRSGFRLENTSRYGEDIWRLFPAQRKEHDVALILNFLALPSRFRPAAKKLFYHLLSADPPDGEDPPSIATVRVTFTHMKAILTWLDKRWEEHRTDLSTLTPDDLTAYRKYLNVLHPRSSDHRTLARGVIRLLWRWRSHLDEHALSFDPRHLPEWGESKAPRRSENATDRLPEETLGPLLGWALRFVDEFSTDILAADAHWRATRTGTFRRPDDATDIGLRIRTLMDEYIASRRPLPGYRGRPNIVYLARSLQCDRSCVERHADVVTATAEIVGIGTDSYFSIPITGRLDGAPWVEGIATHHTATHSLARLERHLQAACYIVIAFLSGMRDSEVKHLRRGCLRIKRDEDKTPYRWTVTSLAFKGEDDDVGVEATWVVGEPVARAIDVLERLQPAEADFLFARLRYGSDAKTGSAEALTTKATSRQIRNFVTYVGQLCDTAHRSDHVPPVGDTRTGFKTSVFRRTLAWFIARRPGGAIAGAMHYRHHSIQMFEGYAGTSASGFRAEVESEQALARGEAYTAMIDAHEHTDLSGPSAEEAARRLGEFGERAQFQGQVALDKHRLKRIMKRHDPAIYPGEYITCVHDPAKALCDRAKRGGGDGLPDHGGCKPLACRNVALTPENVAAWTRELARLEKRMAARPAMPPLLQHRLQQRHAEITEFLSTNTRTESIA